jgi:hypothetical protein
MNIFLEINSHRARQQFLNTNVPFEIYAGEIKTVQTKQNSWYLKSRKYYEVPQKEFYKIKDIKGLTFFKHKPKEI